MSIATLEPVRRIDYHQATPEERKRLRVIVEIDVPAHRSHKEPKHVESMDFIVELVTNVVGLKPSISFPPRTCGDEGLRQEEEEKLRLIRSHIILEAMGYLDGTFEQYYALFIFALFRFKLTAEYLTSLASRLLNMGKTNVELRTLCALARS